MKIEELMKKCSQCLASTSTSSFTSASEKYFNTQFQIPVLSTTDRDENIPSIYSDYVCSDFVDCIKGQFQVNPILNTEKREHFCKHFFRFFVARPFKLISDR